MIDQNSSFIGWGIHNENNPTSIGYKLIDCFFFFLSFAKVLLYMFAVI